MPINEGAPRKPRNKIEIDTERDSLHVIAIKTLMNDTGMDYYSAGEMYKAEAGSEPELLEQIDEAVKAIRLELNKKRES